MCWNMSVPVSYLIAEGHAAGRNMVPRVVLGYGVEWDAARQRLQRMEKGDGVGKVYMGREGGHSCLQLTPGNVLVIERSQDRMGIAAGVLGHSGRDSLGGEGGSCLQDCSECQESHAGGEECLKRCEDLPKIGTRTGVVAFHLRVAHVIPPETWDKTLFAFGTYSFILTK